MKSHNKIKTMWNIIKSETGRKMMKSDGFDHCEANPDLFNNYFLTIAEKITSNICNNTKIDTNNIKNPIHYLTQTFQKDFPNIKFNYTSTKAIENTISFLPSRSSHGYDENSMKILKISASCISSPLCYIFNKAISSGIFPARLKYSVIKPLFKKGDTEKLQTNFITNLIF
jgi:hypothetical protein